MNTYGLKDIDCLLMKKLLINICHPPVILIQRKEKISHLYLARPLEIKRMPNKVPKFYLRLENLLIKQMNINQ